ncbi:MAG: 50S ribosomal protein L21 [bacterium]
MYAIIETGGKQYWVQPGETIRVEKLEAKEGDQITLNALWGASPGGKDQEPPAERHSAKVTAQVLRHLKAPKIIVFKKRVKKAYEKTQGHRQHLTEIQIKEINLS